MRTKPLLESGDIVTLRFTVGEFLLRSPVNADSWFADDPWGGTRIVTAEKVRRVVDHVTAPDIESSCPPAPVLMPAARGRHLTWRSSLPPFMGTAFVTLVVASMILFAGAWVLATPPADDSHCSSETFAAAIDDGASHEQAKQIADGACK